MAFWGKSRHLGGFLRKKGVFLNFKSLISYNKYVYNQNKGANP